MAFDQESVRVDIQFSQEENDIGVSELSNFLSHLDMMYVILERNKEYIIDVSPEEFDENLFYDEEQKEVFLGKLAKSGVFTQNDIIPRVPFNPRPANQSPRRGLTINKIKKESPLLISVFGGGALMAGLWIIAGTEIEYNSRKVKNEESQDSKEVNKKFVFDATSTTDLIAEIRKFFK